MLTEDQLSKEGETVLISQMVDMRQYLNNNMELWESSKLVEVVTELLTRHHKCLSVCLSVCLIYNLLKNSSNPDIFLGKHCVTVL